MASQDQAMMGYNEGVAAPLVAQPAPAAGFAPAAGSDGSAPAMAPGYAAQPVYPPPQYAQPVAAQPVMAQPQFAPQQYDHVGPPQYAQPQYAGQPAPQPAYFVPPQGAVQPVFFPPSSVEMTCPNCQARVRTSVSYESGATTLLLAVLCFFFCCPFFWVPFCMNFGKEVHHSCPSCRVTLGVCRSL
mmetsp:Transcript_14019/g.31052  ORF Transcript_14019/g.31052 Transcript_14019/m.31052 type:complete len:186 (+) Transcript_14019:43-600(+)